MSIAAGDLPLPRRCLLKNMMPRRYRAALLRKVKATAPLPRRGRLKSKMPRRYRAAAAIV
jgi:hypothetical protein